MWTKVQRPIQRVWAKLRPNQHGVVSFEAGDDPGSEPGSLREMGTRQHPVPNGQRFSWISVAHCNYSRGGRVEYLAPRESRSPVTRKRSLMGAWMARSAGDAFSLTILDFT